MTQTNDHSLKIKATCIQCQQTTVLFVNKKHYNQWKNNKKSIQDAMPYLSPGERELLITEFCGDCFDKLFED